MPFDKHWKLTLSVLLAGLLAITLVGPGFADEPEDEKVRSIAGALVCPICSGQSVAESQSQLAQQMRAVIAKKVAEGESREEIIQYFVDRYGETILREPRKTGFTGILWWLPVLSLVGAAGLLAVSMRHWRARSQGPASAEIARLSPTELTAYERQLESDLNI